MMSPTARTLIPSSVKTLLEFSATPSPVLASPSTLVPQLFPRHHPRPLLTSTEPALLLSSPRSQPEGCWRHPAAFLPTPFIRLQLCLQVLWRDVVLLLLTLGRFRFTLPAAAVTAAAQTAAAIAACDEPTEHEQGLRGTGEGETFTACA